MEVLAQAGLDLEPGLVERVDAVDATVAPGEVADGAQEGVVVVEVGGEEVLA